MRRLPYLAGVLLCVAPAWAQAPTSLRAATALVGGKPEVRLRWQAPKGATKVLLYRTDGARRSLMGSTDSSVTPGAKVSYELVEAGAAGKETVLARLADFTVGSDPQPPAPTGLAAQPDEGEVALRWKRLTDAQEDALSGVSYRLERDGKPLHKKPLMVFDARKGENPPFFVDTLTAPATVTYRLALVDGFGRTSPPTTLTVAVPDWRRPAAVGLVIAQLDELKPTQARLAVRRPSAKSLVVARRAQVTWLSAPGNLSPVQYVIDRLDLDNPSAKPVRLTPQPIEGTVAPVDADLLDDLLGEPSWEAGEATREQRLTTAKQRARLTLRLRSLPARRFVDTTIQPDRRYRYRVSALFALNKLETEPTESVALDVPSGVAPAAVAGLQAVFTPAPPPSAERVLAPALAKQVRVRPSLAQRKLLSPQRASQPLSFLSRDDGGSVALSWAAPVGSVGVTYRVVRKGSAPSEPETLLSVTAPETTRYTDRLPRTGARRWTYTITPISRWGVAGAAATQTIEVPATLVPSVPVVLSVLPGEEGTVVVTLQPNDPSEGVSEYIVRVGGKVVPTTPQAVGASLRVTVAQAASGSYTVSARNGAARLESAPSEPLSVAPLPVRPSRVTALKATAGENGVTLTWSAVSGASGYLVQRRTTTGASVGLGGKLSQTNYLDVTVGSGRTYTYRILTVGAKGGLSLPAEVTITLP